MLRDYRVMKNNKKNYTIKNNKKEHEDISVQIQAFIDKGGEIEVLSSAFDKSQDPKCRLGDEMGFFK